MIFILIGVLLILAGAAARVGGAVLGSSSRIHLRHMIDEDAAGAAAVEALLEYPGYFRAVTAACETGLVVAGSLLLAVGIFTSGGVPALVAGIAIAAVLYSTSTVVAIGLARWADEELVSAVAPVLSVIVTVSRKLKPVHRANGDQLRTQPASEDREGVDELIEEGVREGIGDAEDMKLVTGVIELRDRKVGDVMTPRNEIFALPVELPVSEIAGRIAASGYSRVPIFSGDLNAIVGIFHVLDVLKAGPREAPPFRPVATARETESCSDLLLRLLRRHAHLCVVTDAAGHTIGIVTMEDLLEEIVGEIRDEFDEPAPTLAGRSR